jgi:hypothetical protein
MDIASLDIDDLLGYLAGTFSRAPAEGAVVGRTALRNAVAAHLACSELEAEELVDTLVLRGSLRLITTPEGRALWHVEHATVH